jgi:hypothetical protein
MMPTSIHSTVPITAFKTAAITVFAISLAFSRLRAELGAWGELMS